MANSPLSNLAAALTGDAGAPIVLTRDYLIAGLADATVSVSATLDNDLKAAFQSPVAGLTVNLTAQSVQPLNPATQTFKVTGVSARFLQQDIQQGLVLTFGLTGAAGAQSLSLEIVTTPASWTWADLSSFATGIPFKWTAISNAVFTFKASQGPRQGFAAQLTPPPQLSTAVAVVQNLGFPTLALPFTGSMDFAKVDGVEVFMPTTTLQAPFLNVSGGLKLLYLNVDTPVFGLIIGPPELQDGEDPAEAFYDQQVSLYFGLNLSLTDQNGQSVDYQMRALAQINNGSAFNFYLGHSDDGSALLTPATIIGLLDNNGSFFSGTPPVLQQFLSGIGLRSLALSGVTRPKLALSTASVTLGADPTVINVEHPWVPLQDPTNQLVFGVTDFELVWGINFLPEGNAQSFLFQTRFLLLPEVFKGKTADEKGLFFVQFNSDLQLLARFDGTANLNDLIATLTAQLIRIPKSFVDASLSDVGLSLDVGAKSYAFNAGFELDLNLFTFAGQPILSVTDGQLYIKATTPTAASGTNAPAVTTYQAGIGGLVGIGPYFANASLDYDGSKTPATWQVAAQLAQPVDVQQLVSQFLSFGGTFTFPDFLPGQLLVNTLEVDASLSTGNTPLDSYTVAGSLRWTFNLGQAFSVDTLATLSLSYDASKPANQQYSGSATTLWDFSFLNDSVLLGYSFAPDNQGSNAQLTLSWEGLTAIYQVDKKTLTFTLKNWSLGRLIQKLMQSLSDPYFTLSSPWDVLNQISLDGLSLIINLENSSGSSVPSISAKYTLASKIDLGFMSIDGLVFERKKVNGVDKITLGIDGSSVFKGNNPQEQQDWSNLLDPSKGQPVDKLSYTYELLGPSATDAQLLERLLIAVSELGSAIISGQFLLMPQGNAKASNLLSQAASDFLAFLTQTNLSTETNPPPALMAARLAEEAGPRGILNPPEEVVKLLWELSTVRSGGYYLSYYDAIATAGLPDSIFDDSGTATLTLVVTYPRDALDGRLGNFVNAFVSTDTVIQQGSHMTLRSAATADRSQPTSAGDSLDSLAAFYGIGTGRIAELNAAVTLSKAAQVPVDGIIHLVTPAEASAGNGQSASILDNLARYYSVGALQPISATQIANLNPGVSAANGVALFIPALTYVVDASLAPGNSLQSLATYYGLDLDALAVGAAQVTGLFSVGSSLSIDTQTFDLQAVFKQGNAAFSVLRNNPPPVDSPSQDPDGYASAYLYNLYSVLSAGLDGSPWFSASELALPFGPQRPDSGVDSPEAQARRRAMRDPQSRARALNDLAEDSQYSYQQTLGLARRATSNAAPTPARPGLPSAEDNPYRGVGSFAQVNLTWLDIFGNITVTPFQAPAPGYPGSLNHPPLPLRYCDRLIALSAWPNTRSFYTYEAVAGGAQLVISLSLDTSSYDPAGGDKVKEQAKKDLAMFKLIYYQLNQSYKDLQLPWCQGRAVSVELVNSLFAQPLSRLDDNQAQPLLDYVNGVILYLAQVVQGTRPAAPATVQLKLAVDIDAMAPGSILPLSLTLSLRRVAALVEPDVAGLEGGVAVTSPLLPVPDALSASTSGYSQFARAFEALFQRAGAWMTRVGSGTADPGSTPDGRSQTLWAARFALSDGNDGIRYRIDPAPGYFAAQPIARSLTSDSVQIYPNYQPDQPFPSGDPVTLTLTGVDQNLWFETALKAIDGFLAPTYAPSVFLLDTLLGSKDPLKDGNLGKILSAKQTLADAIASTIKPVLSAGPQDGPARAAAGESASILDNLARYYSVGALQPISATQIANLNPGVSAANGVALFIPALTYVVDASLAPGNSLQSLATYYGLDLDALAVGAAQVTGLFSVGSSLSIDTQTFDLQAVFKQGNAAFSVLRNNPPPVDSPSQDPDGYASAYLYNLYSVLSAGLDGSPWFSASELALPFGPQRPDSGVDSPEAQARRRAMRDPQSRARALNDLAEDSQYSYQQTLGLARRATSNAAPTPARPGLPSAEDNPYRGVGSFAQVNLTWLDIFGNITVTPFQAPAPGYPGSLNHPPLPLRYCDRLIALSAWPNTRSFYTYEAVAGGAQLVISLSLDTSSYDPAGGDKVKEQAKKDLAMFKLIYYQLNQSYKDLQLPWCQGRAVSVELVNSLFAQPLSRLDDNQAQPLLDYVNGVILYLAQVVQGTRPAAPATVQLKLAVDIDAMAPGSILPLSLTLSLRRVAALVEPDVAGLEGGVAVTSPLLPVPDALSASTSGYSQFARAFEALFQRAGAWMTRVGSGTADPGSTPDGRSQTLWAARFALSDGNDGIRYRIDPAPGYFAAQPIARSLTSDSVQIYPNYQPDQPFPSGDPVTLTLTGVDQNLWFETALKAIDGFLAPTYAPSVFLLDTLLGSKDPLKDGNLGKILSAKQTLADAIASTIKPVLSAGPQDGPARAAAGEKLRQTLLNQLYSAYSTTAIVGFSVQGSATGEPLSLYGQPTVASAAPAARTSDPAVAGNDNYAFGSGRIALPDAPGESALAFVFNSRNEAARSYVPLDLELQISHLEHDVRNVPGISGYTQSNWISLISGPLRVPLADGQTLNLPVLLRALPEPPTIQGQTATAWAPVPQQVSDLSKWTYTFDSLVRGTAQDSLNVAIALNTPTVDGALRSANKSLVTALAQFVSVYPSIEVAMQDNLSAINFGEPTAVQIAAAQQAVEAFVYIVQEVTEAYDAWARPLLRSAAAFVAPQALTCSFSQVLAPVTVDGQERAETLLLDVSINQVAASYDAASGQISATLPQLGKVSLPLPLVQIAPQQYDAVSVVDPSNPGLIAYRYRLKGSQPAVWLDYADALLIDERRTSLPALNLFDHQNAWASLSVERNRILFPAADIGTLQTNPLFRFSTPVVRFVESISPHISQGAFSLDNLQVPNASLDDYLEVFFAALGAGSNGTTVQVGMEGRYSYEVAAPGVVARTVLPAALLLPVATSLNSPPAFTSAFSQAIDRWRLAEQVTVQGNARVDLTLRAFSADDPAQLAQGAVAADNQPPLLSIETLWVSASKVPPEQGGA
ncbi:hypothetical protein [Pseudomonas protegens]|uniref:hypothetical protein n=1 Tax=Pseudomonas protegens TaxID=380021 RepID=UPI001A91B922|nr:hypothetical protein [Pseudomonas protegens]BCT33434.1 hypothetical protein PproGo58_29290 [Pseudomonas protegens]